MLKSRFLSLLFVFLLGLGPRASASACYELEQELACARLVDEERVITIEQLNATVALYRTLLTMIVFGASTFLCTVMLARR